MPSRQVIDTPCKVNLHLGIHRGRDERGYHRVDSVMVPVSLFDTVTVEDSSGLVVCHEPALEVAPEKTTVWRAVAMLAEALGREPNVRIDVVARIPEKAGLGGSSADAGAVLRALAERWGVSVTDERVVSVARRVGADVAFFLDCRPGLYLGAGDVLERTFPVFDVPVALVMPAVDGVSTKEAYDEFDVSGEAPASYGPTCEALERGDVPAMAAALYNNLAPAARLLCGDVMAVSEWIACQPGVLGSQVSGSGACSFALCESDEVAEAIAMRARERHGWRAWVAHAGGAWETSNS